MNDIFGKIFFLTSLGILKFVFYMKPNIFLPRQPSFVSVESVVHVGGGASRDLDPLEDRNNEKILKSGFFKCFFLKILYTYEAFVEKKSTFSQNNYADDSKIRSLFSTPASLRFWSFIDYIIV